jgi:hypothetical protein
MQLRFQGVNPSVLLHHEPNSTSTLLVQPCVLVVKRHHILVRWSHWLNVPLLLGLVLSGISIYWASPIYQHSRIRLQEISMWQRILESGFAPMSLVNTIAPVRPTGFTTT